MCICVHVQYIHKAEKLITNWRGKNMVVSQPCSLYHLFVLVSVRLGLPLALAILCYLPPLFLQLQTAIRFLNKNKNKNGEKG